MIGLLLIDNSPPWGNLACARRPGCGTFAGGLPSLPHSNFGGKHGTFRGDAICWACDSSGLGGRLYPFSGEPVRVCEADRQITRLCAWGDKMHRKDRPEREEARGLENENSTGVICRKRSGIGTVYSVASVVGASRGFGGGSSRRWPRTRTSNI